MIHLSTNFLVPGYLFLPWWGRLSQRFSERPAADLASILLREPKLDDGTAEVLADIEAERKADFGCAIDFEADR